MPEGTLDRVPGRRRRSAGRGRPPGARRGPGEAGAGPDRASARALDVYANLRPATGEGIDLLIVRELVGGLYYGASGRRPDGSAYDTCDYTPDAIERVARRAFELVAGGVRTSRRWTR